MNFSKNIQKIAHQKSKFHSLQKIKIKPKSTHFVNNILHFYTKQQILMPTRVKFCCFFFLKFYASFFVFFKTTICVLKLLFFEFVFLLFWRLNLHCTFWMLLLFKSFKKLDILTRYRGKHYFLQQSST